MTQRLQNGVMRVELGIGRNCGVFSWLGVGLKGRHLCGARSSGILGCQFVSDANNAGVSMSCHLIKFCPAAGCS